MKRRIPTVEDYANESFKMGLKTHEKFYTDIVNVIQKHAGTMNRDDMVDALKTILNEVGVGLHESKKLKK